MSELKPCPFCGAKAKVEDHGSFKIVGCSKLSMLCPNPRMAVYNDNFHHWNQRAETETEKRLTAIATRHATRADELYEILKVILDDLDCYGGVLTNNRIKANRILDKSRIESEEGL